MECLICYDSKDEKSFPSLPTNNSLPCQHFLHVCLSCFHKLPHRKCPYCQTDWSSFYKPPSLIFSIYAWIAIIESDLPLLEFLFEIGVKVNDLYDLDLAAKLITGKDCPMMASEWWIHQPERVVMKKTYLLCQGILWDENQDKYIIRSLE